MIRSQMDVVVPITWVVAYDFPNKSETDTLPSSVAPRNCLEVPRGGTLRVRYTLTDGETGGYYDLTGQTVYFSVGRPQLQERAFTLRSDVSGHMEIPNPRNGALTIILPATETRRLEHLIYEYELWVVSGAIRTLVVRGQLQVQPTVLP